MKVYDFEGALYKGDIIEDFVDYRATKKEKYKNLLTLAKPMISLYKLNFLSLDKLSKFANKYIKDIDVSEKKVLITAEDFWKINEEKLNTELIKKIKSKDLIVTILPEDFLKPLKLKSKKVLGSIYNYEENKIDFICYNEAKDEAFLKEYKDEVIEEYFTDKRSNNEIARRAKKTTIIK